MAIFPDESGLAGFTEAKDDESGGGDNWSYKMRKAPVKSSPPIYQHPTFHRLDALPVAKPTVPKRHSLCYKHTHMGIIHAEHVVQSAWILF